MKIVIVTSESVPYAKTGGLADVTGALLKEFLRLGEEAFIIMPFYSRVRDSCKVIDTGIRIKINIISESIEASLLKSQNRDYPAYFIRNDRFFRREGLYGDVNGDYHDNAMRFSFFSQAALKAIRSLGFRADIVHVHDWQAALLPFYLKNFYKEDPFFKQAKTVLTIHNLGYQGLFAPSVLPYLGIGLEYFNPHGIEFYGKVNFLKAGIISADALTTVSENYAKEILTEEYGFGLDGVLRSRSSRLYGILNGIDSALWNPETDKYIPKRYTLKNIKGKQICKVSLIKEASLGIKPSQPLIGFVGRFAVQKGIDLIERSITDIANLGAGFVIVGSGDKGLEDSLMGKSISLKDRVYVKVGYDEGFARMIYAGADIFLMPSRYEPCGLTQLIAMRYGTVPIVRATGGLVDTVDDYDHLTEKGSGFMFRGYDVPQLIESLKRAICVYKQKLKWTRLMKEIMKKDFSWENSAKKYLQLFRMISGS